MNQRSLLKGSFLQTRVTQLANAILDQLSKRVKFCQERKIHFISDEVYALSEYPSSDLPNAVPFTSALELDTEAIGSDLSRIHTVWSISKVLGSSGLHVAGFAQAPFSFLHHSEQYHGHLGGCRISRKPIVPCYSRCKYVGVDGVVAQLHRYHCSP